MIDPKLVLHHPSNGLATALLSQLGERANPSLPAVPQLALAYLDRNPLPDLWEQRQMLEQFLVRNPVRAVELLLPNPDEYDALAAGWQGEAWPELAEQLDSLTAELRAAATPEAAGLLLLENLENVVRHEFPAFDRQPLSH